LPAGEITRIQELVHELLVGDVMQKKIISISPSASMRRLREVLRENRISGVPVVDGDLLVGVISVQNLIEWLIDGSLSRNVGDRMTTRITFVRENDPLVVAINKLERFGFGRLPVLKKDSGRLAGMITKSDIVSGLLRKLDVDFRRAELRQARSRHIFEDIIADKSAVIFEYRIMGGKFDVAGVSASGLKTTLLRLGIDAPTARRAATASYEAEMNIVFYTTGGKIRVEIEPGRIRIVAEDHGPGIPDIEKAMEAGYSTAPDWVRELGFGAGMGLQNIKACADEMDITSTVGEGTRIEIVIFVEVEDERG
jgi:CBS domain-containing protein/anti-sigma regulatory factor (Ser/Thr protein kinase)